MAHDIVYKLMIDFILGAVLNDLMQRGWDGDCLNTPNLLYLELYSRAHYVFDDDDDKFICSVYSFL